MVTETRDVSGRFVKGNEVAKKRAAVKEKHRQKVLNEILAEAKGDAVRVKELMLERGSDLELDVNTVLRLAKELAPYQSARKASIEVKNENISEYVIQYNYDNILPPKADLSIITVDPEPSE